MNNAVPRHEELEIVMLQDAIPCQAQNLARLRALSMSLKDQWRLIQPQQPCSRR